MTLLLHHSHRSRLNCLSLIVTFSTAMVTIVSPLLGLASDSSFMMAVSIAIAFSLVLTKV